MLDPCEGHLVTGKPKKLFGACVAFGEPRMALAEPSKRAIVALASFFFHRILVVGVSKKEKEPRHLAMPQLNFPTHSIRSPQLGVRTEWMDYSAAAVTNCSANWIAVQE